MLHRIPCVLGRPSVDAVPVRKPGSVTEYDRSNQIAFHHTVELRRSFLNTDIDARIRYILDTRDGTSIDRRLLAEGLASPESPLIRPIIRGMAQK
jgi:hypothetical protein